MSRLFISGVAVFLIVSSYEPQTAAAPTPNIAFQGRMPFGKSGMIPPPIGGKIPPMGGKIPPIGGIPPKGVPPIGGIPPGPRGMVPPMLPKGGVPPIGKPGPMMGGPVPGPMGGPMRGPGMMPPGGPIPRGGPPFGMRRDGDDDDDDRRGPSIGLIIGIVAGVLTLMALAGFAYRAISSRKSKAALQPKMLSEEPPRMVTSPVSGPPPPAPVGVPMPQVPKPPSPALHQKVSYDAISSAGGSSWAGEDAQVIQSLPPQQSQALTVVTTVTETESIIEVSSPVKLTPSPTKIPSPSRMPSPTRSHSPNGSSSSSSGSAQNRKVTFQ